MAAVKTYLSSHLFSAVVIGGTPGPHGDPGQPGESQVNRIICSVTFTNIPLLFFSHVLKMFFFFIFGPFGDFVFYPKDICFHIENSEWKTIPYVDIKQDYQ